MCRNFCKGTCDCIGASGQNTKAVVEKCSCWVSSRGVYVCRMDWSMIMQHFNNFRKWLLCISVQRRNRVHLCKWKSVCLKRQCWGRWIKKSIKCANVMYLVWLGKNLHYVLSCGSSSRRVLAAPRSLLRVCRERRNWYTLNVYLECNSSHCACSKCIKMY